MSSILRFRGCRHPSSQVLHFWDFMLDLTSSIIFKDLAVGLSFRATSGTRERSVVIEEDLIRSRLYMLGSFSVIEMTQRA